MRRFTVIVGLAANAVGSCVADSGSGTPTMLEPALVVGRHSGFHDVSSESDLVGPAKQPEWTARRAFAETDIYVIPEGEIEFNQFFISSHPRHGKAEQLFESELELGLPWRTQFDVEVSYGVMDGELKYDSTLLELPHALADWGEIPLNPAVDAGWRFSNDESDSYFFRLLLAEQFGKRLHFGANLSFERQTRGDFETQYELNAAMSYVAVDRKLTVGVEMLVEYEAVDGSLLEENESGHSTTVMMGPSLLFKPTRSTHLGLVPLFGMTSASPIAEAFVIFGVDLEPFGERAGSERSAPAIAPVRRPR